MSPYARRISKATTETDIATLALIEDLMRDGRSGLDSLTPAQFDRAAREARQDIGLMHNAGVLSEYCAALGITPPAWAA